ncbi:MAG: hypothetical protein ACLTBV_01515 [Enterocloster bolteae]
MFDGGTKTLTQISASWAWHHQLPVAYRRGRIPFPACAHGLVHHHEDGKRDQHRESLREITPVSPQLLNAQYSVATTAAAEIPAWNFRTLPGGHDLISRRPCVPAELAGFTSGLPGAVLQKNMSCHDFHDCGPLLLPADIRGSGPRHPWTHWLEDWRRDFRLCERGPDIPFKGVFAGIFGFFYAPLVITGLHHMSNAIDLQLIADFGGTTLWPMIALSNIGPGLRCNRPRLLRQ